MVIMRMACNVLCLTSNEFDYNDLIIADIDCTYLLVRRKILRLYGLTPLWWCYENMGIWMGGGAILCTGVYPSAVSPSNPGMHIYAISQ